MKLSDFPFTSIASDDFNLRISQNKPQLAATFKCTGTLNLFLAHLTLPSILS